MILDTIQQFNRYHTGDVPLPKYTRLVFLSFRFRESGIKQIHQQNILYGLSLDQHNHLFLKFPEKNLSI